MTRSRCLAALLTAFLLLLGQTSGGHAAGFIVVLPSEPDPAPPPLPRPMIMPHLPRPPVFSAPLTIANPRVDVRIEGQAVTTTIEQEIVNPNDRPLEADFFFPLPRGAHIDKASMEINGRQTEAELLPADKARGIYEDIVRQMKDPALLEYAGRDVFRARVFPIEARSRKPIRLTYTELLRADDGVLTYRCPLGSTGTAAGARVQVALRADAPLTAIYSPSHPVEVRRDATDPRRATVSWEAARGTATTAGPAGDFQLVFAPEKSDLALRVLTYRDPTAGRDEDGYFLLLAAPRPEAKTAERPAPKDVTFVVDTSGSMAGAKMQQAKKALEYCVNSLNPDDRFEIVRFSSEAEGLFGGLREANDENRKRALAFVRNLSATGGTAIAEALRTALHSRPAGGGEDRPFVVAFLTDGQPTVGPTKEEDILAALKVPGAKDVRVFSFGIGTDVNTHLLDRLAESTRAFSQYVLPEEDIEVKVSSFFARIREPALTGLRLQFGDAVKVRQIDPAELPDLFRGDQLLALGRYSGGGETTVTLTGRAGGGEQTFETRLRFDETASGDSAAPGREFIPRLWATRRVGFLLDEIRLRGENLELRDEVVTLARRFGVVTPYTAYLILDDEERRRVPDARRSLSQLSTDAPAKELARGAFESFKNEKAGDSAVANAKGQGTLRRSEQAGAALSENRALAMSATKASRPAAPMPVTSAPTGSSGRGVARLPTPPPSAAVAAATADRLDAATQSGTRFVNGRAFYQNGTRWVDAATQNRAGGGEQSPQRVQFGSADYFTLLKDHPEAGPFLALGQNVLVALGDSVYEVYE